MPDEPIVEIQHLDQLWFQVAGTRCNLACHHCFISCHPKNHSFGFLSLEQVERHLQASQELGVKEYYFTGGEPFLNPDMVNILVRTLELGPATVLTNGTVFKDEWLQQLQQAECGSRFSLEFRVSLDGFSPATNDPIRGLGTFGRAMRGIVRLVEHGFLPIITAMRSWPLRDEQKVLGEFVTLMKNAGYARPRIKVLPALQIGEEAERTQGYSVSERVTQSMMDGFDDSTLVCSHSRMVSDRGVHVCPILIESADSILGETLQESLKPYALQHGACLTCFQYGAICSNSVGGSKIAPSLPSHEVE